MNTRKRKETTPGNPRPRTGRDDLKLGLRSVLYLKDLNAAYWFSTFRANLQSRVITRQAEQQQKNKTKSEHPVHPIFFSTTEAEMTEFKSKGMRKDT